MTNIVAGNAGNLSQPNTPQEGPSGKSISTGTGLDFLSLILTVNAGQNGSNTHSDKVVHKESIHTNQVPISLLGLPNSELSSSDPDGNIISDDVSNFLKALNLSNDGNNSSVGLSTLKMLNHVANSGAAIGTNQVVSFSSEAISAPTSDSTNNSSNLLSKLSSIFFLLNKFPNFKFSKNFIKFLD